MGLEVRTSVFESVSASLCFISLAIEKKTSSTFIFVFALCLNYYNTKWQKDNIWLWKKVTCKFTVAIRDINKFTHSLEELNAIFISKCLPLWGGNSLCKKKKNRKKKDSLRSMLVTSKASNNKSLYTTRQ